MNQRPRMVALVGVLAVAACGGAPVTQAPDTSPATNAATAPTLGPTASPGSTIGSGEAPGSQTDPNAVRAPDFTLPLGGGGEFALSEEAMPVYMVFWAEW